MTKHEMTRVHIDEAEAAMVAVQVGEKVLRSAIHERRRQVVYIDGVI